MATIDHKAELSRAGAGVSGFWGTSLHLARRYPLGAAGAAIVLLFVLTALFAPYLTSFEPTSTASKSSLARRRSARCMATTRTTTAPTA